MTPVRYHQAAEDELLNEIGYLELRVPASELKDPGPNPWACVLA
jgi:hypothetical protein